MSTSTGQAILAVLESDLLTVAGPALLTFLTNIKANPTPINEAAQWIQLQGALIGAAPQLEEAVVIQAITALTNKLQALMAAAQAPKS